jgi:NitT/TauT family transport system permease protein
MKKGNEIQVIAERADLASALREYLSNYEVSSISFQQALEGIGSPGLVIFDYPEQGVQRSDLERMLQSVRAAASSLIVLSPGLKTDALIRELLPEAIALRKPVSLSSLELLAQRKMGDAPPGRKSNARWQKRSLLPILSAALVLAAWEAMVRLLSIPFYLLPPPTSIVRSMAENSGALFNATFETAMSAIWGFAISAFIGIIAGALISRSHTLERSLLPLLTALQATPIVAIAPLIAVWFGTSLKGKVVMASIIALFPIIVNTTVGLKSLQAPVRDVLNAYNATKLQVLLKAEAPNALPQIFAGLRISATLSVIGAIVAELIVADRGLGKYLVVSQYYLDTPRMFGAVICSAGLGIIFIALIKAIEQKVIFWNMP